MSLSNPVVASVVDTPERIPGTAFRTAASMHLSHSPQLSREALARELRERLARRGIGYHLRTLKRQLSGAVATVPPEVERVLHELITESSGPVVAAEIEQALTDAGLGREAAAQAPIYIACEKMLPFAQLWLHLHPESSKRALAFRLRGVLAQGGINLNVDSLQSILAGKQRLVRREIQDALLKLLNDDGIHSFTDADARAKTMAREIRSSQQGRAFESARQIHEAARTWKVLHKEPSSRRLSIFLKDKLAEQGIMIGLPHTQKLVDGRARRVRHAVASAIVTILQNHSPKTEALAETNESPDVAYDLAWVRAEPIAELARNHVAARSGMTMRKLAIQISRIVGELGYSTSPNTIQPILGGHKKKTRGFIYRAMLQLDGSPHARVPDHHVISALPRREHASEHPVHIDSPAQSESRPRTQRQEPESDVVPPPRSSRTRSALPAVAPTSFAAYRAAIQRCQTLDRDAEIELAWRYQRDGDQSAAHALVESHLSFVVKVAGQYRGYGMQMSDLVEEGNLGLLEAVRRFEPSRNLRFKTYAVYWIRAYIVDHLLREWSIVGGGTGALVSRTFFRLRRERAKLEMQLGEGDSTIDATLASRFHTTEDAIRSMSQRVGSRDTSLDGTVHQDGGPSLVETLRDPSSDPEQEAASAEQSAFVRSVVGGVWTKLDPRERLIVEERLLSDDDDVSLADLGRRLGVSRERVRQLEARTKSKLRSAFEAASAALCA